MTEYVVILEKGEGNWGAYSPDVPGCIAVGDTRDEAMQSYQEALAFHLDGLREDGLPIPLPASEARLVAIAA